MKKFLRISLISILVSAAVSLGAALVMVFWPGPTFTTARKKGSVVITVA